MQQQQNLINFYYTTMGYPVIYTWCKAIDRGYFHGWNGQTSDRVRKFVSPSQESKKGHMDQRQTNIQSTKSSPARPSPHEPDHMIIYEQTPHNNKTNMVFMTMLDIEGQLFDQTGHLPISLNHGNNYIVIFYAVDPNYIKSYPIKSRHRTKILKAYKKFTNSYNFENIVPNYINLITRHLRTERNSL